LYLSLEGALLLASVGGVWWIHKQKWVLKAAVVAGVGVATRLQAAAEILGRRRSGLFPSMALWKAGQSDKSPNKVYDPGLIDELKKELAGIQERVERDIGTHQDAESWAQLAPWVAIGIIVVSIALAIATHSLLSELLAIWLPSLVGAYQGRMARRQLSKRIGVGTEFKSQLEFARRSLVTLEQDSNGDENDADQIELLNTTLKVLCRAAGEYSRLQLEFAIGDTPELPV
jgi:hypothetical protein